MTFRYLGTHGYETLRDALLKVSPISSFNDPFECSFQLTGEPTLAKAKQFLRQRIETAEFIGRYRSKFPHLRTNEAARRHCRSRLDMMAAESVRNFPATKAKLLSDKDEMMDDVLRVACFSGKSDPSGEIRMWSLYARKHFGVRIGFDFPAGLTTPFVIHPVVYSPDRVKVDATIDGAEALRGIAVLIATTKSKAWEYECEHRLLTATQFCEQRQFGVETIDLISFDRRWVSRVDFGVKYEGDRTPLLRLLSVEYPHAQIFAAKCHASDFALTYERLG